MAEQNRSGVTRRRDGDLKYPKVGKRIRTKKMADAAKDRAESELVRQRGGGRCEVLVDLHCTAGGSGIFRCTKPAVHVMHLIGGRGKRGRGISALKEHKLHGCAEHHREIDGNLWGGRRLRRVGGPIPLWTDPYERVGRRQEAE